MIFFQIDIRTLYNTCRPSSVPLISSTFNVPACVAVYPLRILAGISSRAGCCAEVRGLLVHEFVGYLVLLFFSFIFQLAIDNSRFSISSFFILNSYF
jgi:hypothetical protein